jgi:CRISPR-associated endonuclease/helicase Cas3
MSQQTVYVAHTPPDRDLQRWQTMAEHSANVARLAEEFAKPFRADELAKWAGWLHDVGKYSDAFQRYLRECHAAKLANRPPPPPGSAEHKAAGTLGALERFPREIRDILALCVLGHHGGLNAASDTKSKIAESAAKQDLQIAIERACQDLTALSTMCPTPDELDILKSIKTASGDRGCLYEVLTRFVFSCLVDADSLDTEAHFSPDQAAGRASITLENVGTEWLEKLKKSQVTLQSGAADTDVNRVRRQVYEAALAAASGPPGLFSLTVPTGGGKTRSSLAFALAHVAQHGLRRIIYAIPYTSIVDQTAAAFREILGEDAVLEHHSAVEARIQKASGADADEDEQSREVRQRLAAENWNAPLIVTTTVQLFESLFACRTSRCRKLHNIAGSVIILDEVQTLPLSLLTPLVDMLRTLVEHYNVTVVLCTATQPAIQESTPYFKGLGPATPIVPNPAPHFEILKRVTYRVEADPWGWARVAEEMREKDGSCLTILNTKKDALALLEALGDAPNIRHLSTLLCGAHRKDILKDIRAALDEERTAGGPGVLLVSTQVVEAGVDLDFPRVLRAMGPLDRIIQAAGRCNREGLRPIEASEVIVFTPSEGGVPPGEYKMALGQAKLMIAKSGGALNFDSPEIATRYFAELYNLVGKPGLDVENVQMHRKKLDYPIVAQKVRLIKDDTVPVLVKYAPLADEYAKVVAMFRTLLDRGDRIPRGLWRRTQPLTVAIYRHEIERLRTTVEELVPDQLYIWRGPYDPVRGIGGGVDRDPSDLVV